MKFTKEQFEYLEKQGGKFYLDDLPFDDSDRNKMYLLFNALPEDIQGGVISWGFSDTVNREKISEFLLNNQLGLTFDEYYENYDELNKNPLAINFLKLV